MSDNVMGLQESARDDDYGTFQAMWVGAASYIVSRVAAGEPVDSDFVRRLAVELMDAQKLRDELLRAQIAKFKEIGRA